MLRRIFQYPLTIVRFLCYPKNDASADVLFHVRVQADPDGYTMGMITFELAGYKAQEMSDYTYENYDAICRVNTDAAAITVNTEWAAANGIVNGVDGNLFDLVISDPAGKEVSQLDCFTAIKGYLTKIQ